MSYIKREMDGGSPHQAPLYHEEDLLLILYPVQQGMCLTKVIVIRKSSPGIPTVNFRFPRSRLILRRSFQTLSTFSANDFVADS